MARVEGALVELSKRVDGLEKTLNARLSDVDKRIDSLDRRIDELSKRIDYIARTTMILTGSVIATLLAAIILGLLGG